MLIGAYRLALDSIIQGFTKAITPILRGLDLRSAESKKHFAPIIYDVVVSYRGSAVIEANNLLMEEAERFGGKPYIPQQDVYPIQAVEKVLREAPSVSFVADSLVRHVEAGARRQIQASTPEDKFSPDVPEHAGEARSDSPIIYPAGWARVLTGAENCAFCVMLASRGAVYSSKTRAGTDSYRFHNNCDCVVVPVFDHDDWIGKDTADYLKKIWDETRSQSALRDWLKENTLTVPDIRSAVTTAA